MDQEQASNKPVNGLNSSSITTGIQNTAQGGIEALESSPAASRLTTDTNHTTPSNDPTQNQRRPREL